MRTLSQSIEIATAPDKVFSYVTEPAAMAEWIPPLVEVRNIIGAGEGQQFEWTYKLGGLLFRGQSVVVEQVPNELHVLQAIGAVNATWTFRVAGHDGDTKLEIDVAYEVPLPVIGKWAEHIVAKRDARNLEAALANAKDALET
jgi:uncharacterized protein YndB with AHSA1/START domain